MDVSRRGTSFTVVSISFTLPTLTARLSTLARVTSTCFISSPKISLACLLRLDICLMIKPSVPLFTASSSSVSTLCLDSVFLDTWVGKITRTGNGIFLLHLLLFRTVE